MKKLCTYEIENCNSNCVYFYHRYDDNENAWCGKLKRMIFPCVGRDVFRIFDDQKKRRFPKDCPLQDI